MARSPPVVTASASARNRLTSTAVAATTLLLVLAFLSRMRSEEVAEVMCESLVVHLERAAQVLLILRVQDVIQPLAELLRLTRKTYCRIASHLKHLVWQDLNTHSLWCASKLTSGHSRHRTVHQLA